MKRKLLMTTAALAMFATASFAAITVDQVVQEFQDAGYTAIEVKEGPTQIKVEASDGTDKIEVIYDKETGEILKQETYPGEGGEVDPGVDIDQEDEDFLDEDDDEEDEEDEDEGDDEDDGEDDGEGTGDDGEGDGGEGDGDED